MEYEIKEENDNIKIKLIQNGIQRASATCYYKNTPKKDEKNIGTIGEFETENTQYGNLILKKCEEILNKPKNKLSETKIRNALSILSNYRRVILQRIKIVEKQEGNKFKSLEKRYEMFEMTNEQKKEFAENTELIKEFISIIKTGGLIDNRCKSVKINEKEKFALLLEINDILKIRLTTLIEELNKKESFCNDSS